MICPRCNAQQLPNTLFCDQCGEELSELGQAMNAADFYTIRVELLDSRRSFTLPNLPEVIFGRANAQAGTIPDLSLEHYGGREGGVSRRHARLSRRGLHLYLEDLGSTNGSFVNERRLPPNQATRIYPGDVIRLGLLRLSFSISTYNHPTRAPSARP